MTQQLEPCPFCGSADLKVFDNGVFCQNRKCEGGVDWGHWEGPGAREAVIAAWNTRHSRQPSPPDDVVKAALDAFYTHFGGDEGDHEDAMRAALQAAGVTGWRDISTAPKDENVILATTDGWSGEAIYMLDADGETWRWRWAGSFNPLHENHRPLAWQPLPSPPAVKG